MAELEIEDHKVTQAEHDFYRAFVTILEHLKNRAINAELEVLKLRRELDVQREQSDYNFQRLLDEHEKRVACTDRPVHQ